VQVLDRKLMSEPDGGSAGRSRTVLNEGPEVQQLRHTLGQSLLVLSPPQVRELHRILTSAQRALASKALRTARSLVLDQDQGQER
jgi:hypothetical protein